MADSEEPVQEHNKGSGVERLVTSEQRRTSPESGAPDIFTPESAEKRSWVSRFDQALIMAAPPSTGSRRVPHPAESALIHMILQRTEGKVQVCAEGSESPRSVPDVSRPLTVEQRPSPSPQGGGGSSHPPTLGSCHANTLIF